MSFNAQGKKISKGFKFGLIVIITIFIVSVCIIKLILRILKTGISLEAMPPWVSENGFSSFQAVC